MERLIRSLLQAGARFLRPHARLVSRSRLARGPDHSGLRARSLVFLQTIAIHPFADGRQRRDPRILYCSGGRSPAQQRQLQDELDPLLQANPAVDKYFTVAGRAGQGAGVFTVIFLKDAKDRQNIE